MIFVYDKDNDLKMFAKFHKRDLATFYLAQNKQLFSLERFKEKNKTHARKVVVNFEEDIKLWFQSLYQYDYTLRVISKKCKYIKFPKQASRVETDLDGTPKLFTLQSSLIDRLIGNV
jgi:hypothetical protein